MHFFARSRFFGSVVTRHRQSRAAFTLLEVVIGAVLLATLVTGVVTATAAHQKKIRFAMQKNEAVKLADELLTRWDQSAAGIPLSDRGNLSVDGSLAWRTQVVRSRPLCGVPVHVVRLDLIGQTSRESIDLLCSIDVVVNAKVGQR